jgi:hypothetical protein
MNTLKVLNTPIIFNFCKKITFFINNTEIIFEYGNYSKQEILDKILINGLLLDAETNKLYCLIFVNFKFYSLEDRNYILSLLGFNNFFDNFMNKDLLISIKGVAKYELNINFNNIVELKVVSSDNITDTFILETGAFSYSNILSFNTALNDIKTFDFINVLSNNSLTTNNNVLITLKKGTSLLKFTK